MTVALEIAVQDVAGARATIAAGADRLELCQALAVGGLTPSIALVETVVAAVGGGRVNVLGALAQGASSTTVTRSPSSRRTSEQRWPRAQPVSSAVR